MAFLLGIDTGGTFTDAVVLEVDDHCSKEADGKVVAKAKALTTRHDLAIGIAGAAEKAIKLSKCDPRQIGLVSLSTTLATNALVESQGARMAMIAIGFEERDLKNAGLGEALGDEPVIILEGGHTPHGQEAKPLNLEPLEKCLDELSKTVSGFAVVGYFAVRNNEHEIAVRDMIIKRTGKAVTCSHELSAQLNGPKRALTTVLNARLVPMITGLIEATKSTLKAQNISAPLMVVRGDGALISADFAIRRPIETILSGPAASLIGAKFLTGVDAAFVNDIGGTTSDVAILEGGAPRLDPNGARVGNHRTMVEAVAMSTFGLGGDSEVGLEGQGLNPKLALGPKRLVPICLIAQTHKDVVHKLLDEQLKSILNNRYDGRFAFRTGAGIGAGLSSSEEKLYGQITQSPQAVEDLLAGAAQVANLNTLVSRGLVQIAGLTPSDAMHALGRHEIWDAEASLKALRLFGRKRDGGGRPLFEDPILLAEKIVQRVQRRSAEITLETSLQIDGYHGGDQAYHPILQGILDDREKSCDGARTVNLSLSLDRPIIGLGASAHAYHPKAAELLGTEAIVPEHADVANAIGAVVGKISLRVDLTITQPSEGQFHVAGIDSSFRSEKDALEAADKLALEQVAELAKEAGAGDIEIVLSRDVNHVAIESRKMLIEATVSALATGRPPIAR